MLLVFIISFSVAFFVSSLCSLAESVLLSLSTAQIVEITEINEKIGRIWENFKKDVNAPVTAILTLNTAAHTIGAAFAGSSFADLTGEKWLGVFSVGFTFLMLQFSEILPKTLGVRFNKRLAFVIARPLSWLTFWGEPLFKFFRLLNRPFESKPTDHESTIGAVREIALLTSLARSNAEIDDEQRNIILATLKLSGKKVRDIMVDFKEVSTLSDDMSVVKALEVARNDSHSRFPVCYKGDLTNIIGYVSVKELFDQDATIAPKTDETAIASISPYIRKITRVEDVDKASDVLKMLVKLHEHIALVVDSTDQSVKGLLTLEDLVEELVGEILDEFDLLPEKSARRPLRLEQARALSCRYACVEELS
ncbi:MAG: CNNM domain-containing protein [Thermoguttaceae bacterium]